MACCLESEIWRPVASKTGSKESDDFFLVKCVAASQQSADADEVAFGLALTDLITVWKIVVTHGAAAAWVKELIGSQLTTFGVLTGMRDNLLDGTGLEGKGGISAAGVPPKLTVRLVLTKRYVCRFECEPLPERESAVVLREEMILPLLHLAAYHRTHCPDADADKAAPLTARELNLAENRAFASIYRVLIGAGVESAPLPSPSEAGAAAGSALPPAPVPAGADADPKPAASSEPGLKRVAAGGNTVPSSKQKTVLGFGR
ncbi:hypothetical protein T492DRAFT_949533 [Pavlovales sp. CCMP2436]|nr:hypothetical protein T492DRAFT_949533 [Pavlovales sp. CCMP2436]